MTTQGESVRERVEAAIRLRRHASPASRVVVSAICRDARVSRANLYAHYPDLIQAIRSTWLPSRAPARQPREVAAPAPERPTVDKALLYLCLELKAEVEALRKRIECPLPVRGTRKR